MLLTRYHSCAEKYRRRGSGRRIGDCSIVLRLLESLQYLQLQSETVLDVTLMRREVVSDEVEEHVEQNGILE